MGGRAEKLEEMQEVHRLRKPISHQVVDLSTYLAASADAPKRAQSDDVPKLFWAKEAPPVNDSDRVSITERDYPSAEGPKAKGQIQLSPYIASALLLALISSAGVFYGLSANETQAVPSPAPEPQQAFSSLAFPADEAPLPKKETALSLAGPLEVEDPGWTETLAKYQQLLGQQNQAAAGKQKQADNQRLLEQFADWARKSAK
ncbi:MAG TPA: hypothetical protein VE986_08040 [Hyphomicrobiales bacterium]|nr:hypothetical protein [Hyphomicrobiales bacterium]